MLHASTERGKSHGCDYCIRERAGSKTDCTAMPLQKSMVQPHGEQKRDNAELGKVQKTRATKWTATALGGDVTTFEAF